jgi:hypothetical protein
MLAGRNVKHCAIFKVNAYYKIEELFDNPSGAVRNLSHYDKIKTYKYIANALSEFD